MEQFDTERHKVTVTHKGKEHTYYARELGYFEFQELDSSLDHMPISTEKEKNNRGLAFMKAVTVASIETEERTPAFDAVSLKRLPKECAEPLSDAAMKAQGIDMEKIRKEAKIEEAAETGKV